MPVRFRYAKLGPQTKLKAVARRLRMFREWHGLSQQTLADRLGIGLTAWNNYERGHTLIPIDRAGLLRLHFGVSLDWIYWGEPPSPLVSRNGPRGRSPRASAKRAK